MNGKTVTAFLRQDQLEALDAIAKRQGIDRSKALRWAIDRAAGLSKEDKEWVCVVRVSGNEMPQVIGPYEVPMEGIRAKVKSYVERMCAGIGITPYIVE
jgi:hypothetical protein